MRRGDSPDAGDAVKEAKGKRSLSTPALSRADARRAPERVSKVRPDAEETLRLVLATIDAMKAEDTVTIDLTGKTTIADSMVVTSGRSNRQVGAIADRVLEDLRKAGVRERPGRGHAALRLGADRRRRRDRPCVPAGSPRLLPAREDVGARSDGPGELAAGGHSLRVPHAGKRVTRGYVGRGPRGPDARYNGGHAHHDRRRRTHEVGARAGARGALSQARGAGRPQRRAATASKSSRSGRAAPTIPPGACWKNRSPSPM